MTTNPHPGGYCTKGEANCEWCAAQARGERDEEATRLRPPNQLVDWTEVERLAAPQREPLVPGMSDVQALEDIDTLGSLEHALKRIRAQLERMKQDGVPLTLIRDRLALYEQLASVYDEIKKPLAPHVERIRAAAAAGAAERLAKT